jgi:UDP:flavonoid glycosyltransferase YjiC (YdhE family)
MSRRKILFANVPIDGHFNPLTDLAVYLKNQGHDVRWYAGKAFDKTLQRLSIPHFPFNAAKEINQFNIDDYYPERTRIKSGVKKLQFDLKYFFVYRAPEYFTDIRQIYEEFPFDIMVCDSAFTAVQLVRRKLNVHVVCLGIFPLMQTSKDCAPYGFGLAPRTSFFGRIKQSLLRSTAKNLVFKESMQEYNKILSKYGLPPVEGMLFDVPFSEANLYLQSGVPGFEYKRSDVAPIVRFVGGLRTFKDPSKTSASTQLLSRLDGSKNVILVSQGTFESDHSKLINPTLEALKDTDYLILVATGFHHTEILRKKYPQQNIIIEDFMNFDEVMPKCDVYVTNGGYGGVLLSIDHALPMVCAGVNEGKNEICTRVGYFKIGIDLKTESAKPQALKEAVEEVVRDKSYKQNIEKLRDEFASYDTRRLCEKHILELK